MHTIPSHLARKERWFFFAESGEEGSDFVLVSGQPINEPIVQSGPFVMNTRKEIGEAMDDFSKAKNGFEDARTWSSQISKKK